MSGPPIVLVAHGSRDPRHAATVTALRDRVRALRPGQQVEVGYLDFHAPSVPQLLRRLDGEGAHTVVAVPLLIGRAFHAKSDIPAVLREAAARQPRLTVHQAPVLGPHPLLVRALERRLAEAGVGAGGPAARSGTGIVLAAAGSSDPEAIAAIAQTAREWRRASGWCAVRPAFASATPPRTADAVRALREEDGARRVAVAQYVLAPGRLPDRIAAGAREAGAEVLAPVLGASPELARLVLLRAGQAHTALAQPALSLPA
jgi:sirohydrochlorin ferrochelatase